MNCSLNQTAVSDSLRPYGGTVSIGASVPSATTSGLLFLASTIALRLRPIVSVVHLYPHFLTNAFWMSLSESLASILCSITARASGLDDNLLFFVSNVFLPPLQNSGDTFSNHVDNLTTNFIVANQFFERPKQLLR